MMKSHILIVILLASALVGCRQGKMNPRDFTQVNVTRHLPEPPAEKADTAALPIPAAPKDTARQAPAPAAKYYHVIVASYPDQASADREVERLKAKGFAEACVVHRSNRYRVSIAHFADKQAALDERARLCELLKQDDLWIARY